MQWAPSSSSIVSDLIYSTVGDSPIVQRNRLRPATKENVMNFYEKKKPKVQSWRQHQNISVEFPLELQAIWDNWIFSTHCYCGNWKNIFVLGSYEYLERMDGKIRDGIFFVLINQIITVWLTNWNKHIFAEYIKELKIRLFWL